MFPVQVLNLFLNFLQIIFRFHVRYILSEPKAKSNWKGEIGRMTNEMADGLFKMDSKFYSEYCLVCGPLPFNDLCEKTLRSAGFDENHLHLFRG